MKCKHCQADLAPIDSMCPNCGAEVEVAVEVVAEKASNPYAAPQTETVPIPADPDSEGDATGGLIPYKNPKALIAYYLGIVSGLPLIGFPIGVAAFILGILGLRDRKRNPVIKGSLHAWVGIGCGGLFAILWGLLIGVMLIGAFAGV